MQGSGSPGRGYTSASSFAARAGSLTHPQFSSSTNGEPPISVVQSRLAFLRHDTCDTWSQNHCWGHGEHMIQQHRHWPLLSLRFQLSQSASGDQCQQGPRGSATKHRAACRSEAAREDIISRLRESVELLTADCRRHLQVAPPLN